MSAKRRARPEIKCLTIGEPAWEQAKELAEEQARSVSNYIRCLINEQYEKRKREEVITKEKTRIGTTGFREGNLINSTP